jgi:hypothetical protein
MRMAGRGGSIALPYGVADAASAGAYIAVRRAALLAVDLGDGTIRSRLERPLLAMHEGVVVFEPRGAGSVALLVLAADGQPVCESPLLAVPPPADPWTEDLARAAGRSSR